jgi:poly-gamma-glutamate capsule biosynthesis protein CapA/YwtB (metallophosphatase superfamily)
LAGSTAAARPWRVVWIVVFAVALLATGASGVPPAPSVTGGSGFPTARPDPDRVADADAAAPTAEPTPPPRQRLVIHGAGDVNLDPNYIPALRANGWDHAWSGLEGLFAEDDLTVVNLECPVSDRGAIVEKQFNFRCDPAALPAARQAGVEVVNLANNHSGDYGPQALLDSLGHTRAADLLPVGVGANAAAAAEPAIVEVGGWTIAVLGFGGVIPSGDWLAGRNRPGMADGDDIESMTAAIRAADARADLVFVTIHWGAELETEPQSGDVARAHAMIDAGADGIFGHHAHRLQPMGTYQDRPIAWGLGNFVWPSLSAAGSRTAVAEVVVEPDGTVTGCLLPAEIVSSGHPVLTGPRSCG